jgi:hypothetical protein
MPDVCRLVAFFWGHAQAFFDPVPVLAPPHQHTWSMDTMWAVSVAYMLRVVAVLVSTRSPFALPVYTLTGAARPRLAPLSP